MVHEQHALLRWTHEDFRRLSKDGCLAAYLKRPMPCMTSTVPYSKTSPSKMRWTAIRLPGVKE
jgi:hypothetical protein